MKKNKARSRSVVALLAAAAVLGTTMTLAASPALGSDTAACEPDAELVERAKGYYERRKAAKPQNDWARWLMSVGVDVGAGVAPFTAEEMDQRVRMWGGWKPFRAEFQRLADCVPPPEPDTTPPPEPQQSVPQQQSEPQQSDLTPVQTPRRLQQTSCDLTSAKTQAEGAYTWQKENGEEDNAAVFYRALIAFDVSPLPAWSGARISGPAPTTPLTLAEAKTERGSDTWAGWNPIIAALECLKAEADKRAQAGRTTPPATATVVYKAENSKVAMTVPSDVNGPVVFNFGNGTAFGSFNRCDRGGYDYVLYNHDWRSNRTSIRQHTINVTGGGTVEVPIELCASSVGKTFTIGWGGGRLGSSPIEGPFNPESENCDKVTKTIGSAAGTRVINGVTYHTPDTRRTVTYSHYCRTTVTVQ